METTNTVTRSIHDIKDEREAKQTQLFNECGLFWAFSNQQFTENKTPLKEGEKYVSIGGGGYLPKGNLDKFLDGMKEQDKWYKAEVKANKGARRASIVYELANHEAYYTGTIDDTMDALGKEYTRKEVLKVYLEERAAVLERN